MGVTVGVTVATASLQRGSTAGAAGHSKRRSAFPLAIISAPSISASSQIPNTRVLTEELASASGIAGGASLEKTLGAHIEKLKNDARYRVFISLGRISGEFPNAVRETENGLQPITVWCSNDYLGMGQNSAVTGAMHEAIDTFGAGAGGTRNISGTHLPIVELEREIAELLEKPSALVFGSGYAANEASLSVIGKVLPNVVFFSDDENHASMIAGMKHSGAKTHVYRHNDLAHLESLLLNAPSNATKIVAFESVYSMTGDFAPLVETLELAKRHCAITFLDETHAVGLYGPQGGGRAQELRCLHLVDILQGGLGKGYGVVGGFVAAGTNTIDTIRSHASNFIFTTTMPPAVAAAALASVKHLRTSSVERQKVWHNVCLLKRLAQEHGVALRRTPSHIAPLMVGDSAKCQKLSKILLDEFGLYMQPINYPTVPVGTERLRITVTACHEDHHIEALVKALATVLTRQAVLAKQQNEDIETSEVAEATEAQVFKSPELVVCKKTEAQRISA